MKEFYSIGEVAALLGISAQTLRFYSNQGLIEPRKIDGQTGYRYYSYDQFHKIDRIKYLQGLGMSLSEIREALGSGKVADLLACLENHQAKKRQELIDLKRTMETLDWYIDYYKYLGENKLPSVPFKRTFPARHFLSVPMSPGEPLFGPGGYRLAELKNKPRFRNLPFLRQHGYILNYQALIQRKIQPFHYFVYLKENSVWDDPAISTIPAGEFLCFRGRILIDDWQPDLAFNLLDSAETTRLVVADEYEDNLSDFSHDMYEIQILLQEISA
ncbi:hypothetical protein C4J81_08450 [Deltaproteobacteria bacterium Smac51]|nr:hypothetical protein C4J81_08450 [Deltaproteobacteria bacterium Smac51]